MEIPLFDLTNTGLTVILLLKVATIEQVMKNSDSIEYQNPPVIQFFHSIKP